MNARDAALLQAENERLREALLLYEAYDVLTGLYRKNAFYERVHTRLKEQPQQAYDIVCLDVERFKLVNDLYGADEGDALLRYMANSLRAVFAPKGAILARLSNDVFAMCIAADEEEQIEEKILGICRDYPLEMSVTPAIGVCRVSDRAQRVNLMCDWAMIALRSIKGNSLKHMAIYDSSQRSRLLEEQELRDAMHTALARREFEIFIQPKCNMCNRKIIGGEVLVRWRHPVKGLIPPGKFIPAFERNGFIKKLDVYVWEEAAAWLRHWMDTGRRPVPLSVNVSRIDLFGMDVSATLAGLLKKYRLAPELLELEVTESAYVHQTDRINEMVRSLMSMGFAVLMDDFGSGYSSLNMLSNISVDVLKLDMRFLARGDQKSKNILQSVVRMSKWLNLPVIAEGVQTQSQADFLMGLGCLYAQGYYYYAPMPLSDFEALLAVPDKVDYADGGKPGFGQEKLLDFHDLFNRDATSDQLLENVIGAIALYSFADGRLSVLRGTQSYHRLVGGLPRTGQSPNRDVLDCIAEEDRPAFRRALQQARETADESGVELCIRRHKQDGEMWLRVKLFYLADRGGASLYYATLFDVTQEMAAVERLRISEEQFCLAMEASDIVLFDLDVTTHEARYSKYAQKALNLDDTVVRVPEGIIAKGAVCEESQEAFREMYNAIYRGNSRANCLVRVRLADGSTVRDRITLTAVKDKQGKTVKAVGTVETVKGE